MTTLIKLTISALLSMLEPATTLEPCSPGICCTWSRPQGGGIMYGNCTAVTGAAMCNGSYLDCGSECYSGDSQCQTGSVYNECCI